MNPFQRKFSYMLADRVLSEYSSPEEDLKITDFDTSGGVNQALIKDNNTKYLDEVVKDRSQQSERLLEIYRQNDEKRTKKWTTMNPLLAEKQSLQQLKFLIARNFTRKAGQKASAQVYDNYDKQPSSQVHHYDRQHTISDNT